MRNIFLGFAAMFALTLLAGGGGDPPQQY
jgi:hypothetical protein